MALKLLEKQKVEPSADTEGTHIHLYGRDSLRVANALINPPAPNEALRKLMRGRT